MSAQGARKVRFGLFEVDFEQHEVRNRGVRIKLHQKPFQILELLLRKPGALVTRDELAQHLWPNLHVSFDRGLNTAVNTLRHALGDSPRSCRFIETRSGLGYRFIASVEEIHHRGTDGDSIAVLPFENMTGDPAMAVLADGIAESVLVSLSSLRDLRVIARTTAFRFRTPENEPEAAGTRLNVRAVLTGRLARDGAWLVTSAELVEVQTGRRLWGEQYRCLPAGIFAVERDISMAVSRMLSLPSDPEQKTRLSRSYTANFEAYQDYLKGRYFYNKMSEEDLRKSIAYFESALKQDPHYSLAYTGLADTYSLFAFLGVVPGAEAHRQAKELALIALQIDDQLAEAHASLAGVKKLFDWDWTGAEAEYVRALELNPNYVDGHHWYAALLSAMARPEEAMKAILRAQELDPLSLVVNMEIAWTLYMARDFQGALEQSWRTLVLEPKFPAAQHTLGLAYEQLGMHEEAITEFENARTCSGNHPAAMAALGHAYGIAGRRDEASGILRELDQMSQRRYVSPYFRSLVYAGLGAHDPAFHWMEKACEERDVWLVWLHVEPRFDALRPDPRFDQLARKLRPGEVTHRPLRPPAQFSRSSLQ